MVGRVNRTVSCSLLIRNNPEADLTLCNAVAVMPMASEMAGVNMRLEAGAIRELHWHKTAEVSLTVCRGMRVTDERGSGPMFSAYVSCISPVMSL